MSGKVRVLVCDDSGEFRRVLGMVLALGDGLEVVGEASDGREAIERAERCRPDVVLLDLAMPVLDGLEALPEIRRVAPQAAVIVLSAFEARAMAQRALELGAAGYLEKGATPEAIIEAVERRGTPSAALDGGT
jgi:DNA-binding NarL/FixJ family response regulator